MNNKTRNEIGYVMGRLNRMLFNLTKEENVTFETLAGMNDGEFEKLRETVLTLADDEREKADNMFERFSGTDRYDAIDNAASNLEDAADSLEAIESGDSFEDIENMINDALSSLLDAKE